MTQAKNTKLESIGMQECKRHFYVQTVSSRQRSLIQSVIAHGDVQFENKRLILMPFWASLKLYGAS